MSSPPYTSYMPMGSPSSSRNSSPSMDRPSPERNFLTPQAPVSQALSRSSSFNSQHSRSSPQPQFSAPAFNKPIDPLEAAAITAASSPTVLPWPSCYLPQHHAQTSPASNSTTPTPYSFAQQQLQQNYFAPMPMMLQQQTPMQNAIPPSMQYTCISPPQEFCLPPSAFERQP